MSFRAAKNTPTFSETAKQTAIVAGLFIGACALGAAVVLAGGDSSTQTLLIGAAAFTAVGWVACVVLELPVMTYVRFAFIASFFFKADISFYKIDEWEDPSGFNISLTLLTALVLFVYEIFSPKEIIREKVFSSSFSLLLIALFVCAGISVLYASTPELSWFALWGFLNSTLIAYVVASHFSQSERLVQLIIGLGIGLLFTGIVAFSQYFFDFPTDLPSFGTGTEEELLGTGSYTLARVPAFMRTPTEMAWVVSVLIPLVLAPVIGRVKSFENWQKFLLLAGALSGTVALILSLARGSWISFVVGIAIVVLFGWYRLSQSERRTYFISAVGTIILGCVLLAPLSYRVFDRLTEDDKGSSLIRIPLMATAGRMIGDNPFVGVGLNGYRANMTRYDETSIFVSQIFPNPVHNVFAHITTEIGIPGGIIFCLLLIVVLFECFKLLTIRDRLLFALALGATAAIIAFIISAMKEPGSLGSVRPPMRTLFLLFGMVYAIGRMRRRLFL